MRQLIYMAVWLFVCTLIALFGSALLGMNFLMSFGLSAVILLLSGVVDRSQKHVPDKFFTPIDLPEPQDNNDKDHP